MKACKRTHYGDFFHVKTKVDANNLAYTGAELGLHTDLPYYRYTPGTQFLHCIQQTQALMSENILTFQTLHESHWHWDGSTMLSWLMHHVQKLLDQE